MSRISLKETYDNRSVIAQIAKVTDTAEDAAETVEQKAAEINDAITEVNAAVQAAEGAVTTANAASASAQQSAQTVAGYNTRLTTAEGEIDTLQSDLNGVTLRVQTAEGNIVTIQGRVTALETADGQNIKINRINDYALGLTGNQIAGGIKTFASDETRFKGNWPRLRIIANNVDVNSVTEMINDAGNITVRDVNDQAVVTLRTVVYPGGRSLFQAVVRNANGTLKYVTLAEGSTQ